MHIDNQYSFLSRKRTPSYPTIDLTGPGTLVNVDKNKTYIVIKEDGRKMIEGSKLIKELNLRMIMPGRYRSILNEVAASGKCMVLEIRGRYFTKDPDFRYFLSCLEKTFKGSRKEQAQLENIVQEKEIPSQRPPEEKDEELRNKESRPIEPEYLPETASLRPLISEESITPEALVKAEQSQILPAEYAPSDSSKTEIEESHSSEENLDERLSAQEKPKQNIEDIAEPTEKEIMNAAKGVEYDDLKDTSKDVEFYGEEVEAYLREIGMYRLLSADEETELAKRKDAGDEKARAALANGNLRLVVSIAKKKKYQSGGLTLMDLVQCGNEGLMEAVTRFDCKRGIRFSTYACYWIKQRIMIGIADQGRTIRLPRHMCTKISKIKKVTDALEKQGEAPTVENVSAKIKISREVIEGTLGNRYARAGSLDQQIGEDLNLLDVLEAPPTDFYAKIRYDSIRKVLGKLREKERLVINLRHGLKGRRTHTLEEIGKIKPDGLTDKEDGLTRERVRQIEAQGLRRLRHPSLAKFIRDFYE